MTVEQQKGTIVAKTLRAFSLVLVGLLLGATLSVPALAGKQSRISELESRVCVLEGAVIGSGAQGRCG